MRKLVTCFSASGVTRRAATELAKAAGADFYEIEPVEKYSRVDLDWNDKSSRSTLEMKDPSSRPSIKACKVDISSYDIIYIGFPIWWGLAPREINTFIESCELSGKKLVIFATSGGSGLSYAVSELKKTYPFLDIVEGRLLKGTVTSDLI